MSVAPLLAAVVFLLAVFLSFFYLVIVQTAAPNLYCAEALVPVNTVILADS